MEPEMQFLRAPQENLQTWNLVTKIISYSILVIVIVLLMMALFLV